MAYPDEAVETVDRTDEIVDSVCSTTLFVCVAILERNVLIPQSANNDILTHIVSDVYIRLFSMYCPHYVTGSYLHSNQMSRALAAAVVCFLQSH